jgi:ureidoglycolate hydrolase
MRYPPTISILENHSVTSQDFIKFWSKIFVFVLLVLIENSQGFETFDVYLKALL